MTTANLIGSPLWVAAGWTMLHFCWIGTAIGLIALCGRRALRSVRPEIRYAFALICLLAMAVAPVTTFDWVFDPSPGERTIAPVPRAIVLGAQADMRPVTIASDVSARTERPGRSLAARTPFAVLSPWSWNPIANSAVLALPWLWLAGSPLTFALLASGLIGAERLRRQSLRIDSGEIPRRCQSLASALRMTRHVAIGVCDHLASPVLIGILRPMILLPPAALSGWTIEQLDMVLWHELAHLRRWDNLVNLVQRIVESLLFFHPAVWWVSAWARLEREHCCDRMVVTQTGRARAYAETLAALAGAPARRRRTAGLAMAENQVVARIRRILDIQEHTMSMKLSRWAVGGAAVLVLAPVFVIGSNARQTGDLAASKGSKSPAAAASTTASSQPPSPVNTEKANARLAQLDRDQAAPRGKRQGAGATRKAAVRKRGLNEPEWKPRPVPATIPIRVIGQARDEKGNPVPRAVIFLYSAGVLEAKLVGQANTDANGNYVIDGAQLPVVTALGHVPLLKEITPYAPFVVCGMAPGFGLGWSQGQSMYAWAEPNPDDIQGRLPLGQSVELNLTLPKAAKLSGRVVDDDGQPVADCKVQISFANLLDETGRETDNALANVWEALPGSVGFAIADREGRFLLDRLPERALFYLTVQRPEALHTLARLFAATIDGPNSLHAQPARAAFNGRLPHDAQMGNLNIAFPRLSRVAVSLVGDDTQSPVAGIGVYNLNDNFQVGTASFGKTDAAGKAVLWLPPGQYRAIRADPPIQSRYIRTEQGPLIVESGRDDQSYDFLLRSGCELQIEAVEAGTNKPVPEALFRKIPLEQPSEPEPIRMISPSFYGGAWTNAAGTMRAVLAPEPGKRYRLEFAGIHQPNMPDGAPDAANKQGYRSSPDQSEPVELEAGKTIRLRFVLRKVE